LPIAGLLARNVPGESLAALEMATRASSDLEVVRVSWSRRSFGVSRWSIVVRNRSTQAGYRDPAV
jgi:hypothetical protein